LYTLDYVLSHKKTFFFSAFSAFLVGLCISVFLPAEVSRSARGEALHKAKPSGCCSRSRRWNPS
jgi:hypothetical protein